MKNNIQYTKHKTQNTRDSGQILVIILLVMMVGLTVGLSLFSRTTQDLAIARRIEESAKAFAAAEAGVEQVLKGAITESTYQEFTSESNFDIEIVNLGGTSEPYPRQPSTISFGDVMTVWLVNHDDSNNLIEAPTYTSDTIDLCWEDKSPAPALIVTLIYKDSDTNEYKLAQGAYDPDNRGNNFIGGVNASGGYCGGDFKYSKNVNFTNFGGVNSGIDPSSDILIALRIRPVYSATKVSVSPQSGGSVLPNQGKMILASGNSGTSNRQIKVVQSYRALASFFDNVLFSASGNLDKTF